MLFSQYGWRCFLQLLLSSHGPLKAKEFVKATLNSRDISVTCLFLGCQHSTSFQEKEKVALEPGGGGSSHPPPEVWGEILFVVGQKG